jgi:hypothetical protein
MEKLTDSDKASTPRASERKSAVSVFASLASALLLIILTGYLTMQLQLSEIHAFMGFDSRPVGVSGDWLPYVWRLSLILLALAAVVVYRIVIQGAAARLLALVTLAVVVFVASPIASGSRLAEEQYPLLLAIAVEGAKSPLILGFIGAIAADLIARRRRAGAH